MVDVVVMVVEIEDGWRKKLGGWKDMATRCVSCCHG